MGLTNAWNVATTSLATNAGLTSIVSRNISNAQNVNGYVSTKVANLATASNGAATVLSIRDLTNATLFNSMLSSTSANSAAQALSDGLTQLQQTVSDATTTSDATTAARSPSTLLQSLSSALQAYSASPGSSAAASAVLTAAQNMANGLNSASATVANVRETADQDMAQSVSTVNSLLAQFQDVNTAIVKGSATGADISDALDQRDAILQSLSKEIGVTTTTGANGSMAIYTDSGATLFDTVPRSVTMTPTNIFSASTIGAAVTVDGVPVTGASAVMPIHSGALAGLANLRDTVSTQYQAQLDSIAGGLVNSFAETNAATGGKLPGLFTFSGATAIPDATLVTGLAGQIQVSSAVDPAQGGGLSLIRDGGINGASTIQNSSGAAGYNALIAQDISALGATTAFPAGSGLSSSTSLTGYAADSASYGNEDALATARAFGAAFDHPEPHSFDGRDLAPERKLRIGYVSGDFNAHPVAFFSAGAIEAHDAARFEVHCYYNCAKNDEWTARFRNAAAHWRAIYGKSDAEVADMVREDGVDILVDLAGHTNKTRLPLFGLKPAPVQVHWVGHTGTTGLPSMDYLILDPVSAPPGADRFYSEALVRLPFGRFCYIPLAPDAPLAEPPCLARDYVTFGCFNNITKLVPGVVRLWARVLNAVPGSRLILKSRSLSEASVRESLARAFEENGLAPERIEMRGATPYGAMLAEYSDIDIALDPFPFGGATTTCDALWMGVPVITLASDRLASRQTLSFLHFMEREGLAQEEFATDSPDDYVAKAVALAANPNRLKALRPALREALRAAPFSEPGRFVAGLEQAYRIMWRRRAAGEKPTPLNLFIQ
jgi:flagellar hook-associated protein 1